MGYLKLTFKPCPSFIINVFTQAFTAVHVVYALWHKYRYAHCSTKYWVTVSINQPYSSEKWKGGGRVDKW